MWITIVLTILIVAGLGLVGFVIWRKLPQVRMIDPSTDKDSISRKKKYDIMKGRVERAGGRQIDQFNKSVLRPVSIGFQNFVRRMAGKLTAVERKYQAKQKETRTSRYTKEELEKMVTDADVLVSEEEFDKAEKKYIEVISYDPKFVPAYEYLGRLYLRRKDYDLARETFSFLVKLSPKDASVTASLGEVEDALGNLELAFEYYKKASSLSPKNPKYLDFFIESAIETGNKYEANLALDRLREVNPDNNKIDDFEEQIQNIGQ